MINTTFHIGFSTSINMYVFRWQFIHVCFTHAKVQTIIKDVATANLWINKKSKRTVLKLAKHKIFDRPGPIFELKRAHLIDLFFQVLVMTWPFRSILGREHIFYNNARRPEFLVKEFDQKKTNPMTLWIQGVGFNGRINSITSLTSPFSGSLAVSSIIGFCGRRKKYLPWKI